MGQDQILRLYTRLKALRDNLPSGYLDEQYVREYNEIVDLLSEETSLSLGEYKVPKQEGRKCHRNFLLVKLDALLAYFQVVYLSEEKPQMGFRLPNNN